MCVVDACTPKDIKATMDNYFGKDGDYEGVEFTSIICTHGINSTGDNLNTYTEPYGEHIIQIAHPERTFERVDFTDVSDIFLSYNNNGDNLWSGCVNLSCFGGLMYYDIGQSILKLPDQAVSQDIHCYSPTTFYQTGWQGDSKFVEILPDMARSNKPFSISNIKTWHQNHMTVDRSTPDYTMPTEIVFKSGETPDLDNLPYEHLDNKLNFVITNLRHNPDLISQYRGALTDFSISDVEFDQITNELSQFNSTYELRTELCKGPDCAGTYGSYLRFAEAIYDTHTGDQNNAILQKDVIRAYSGDPAMIIDRLRPEASPADRLQAITLLNKIVQIDPETFIDPKVPFYRAKLHNAHFLNCQQSLTEVEKIRFLRGVGWDDTNILLEHFDTWSPHLSDNGKAEILITIAEHNTHNLLWRYNVWNTGVSESAKEKILSQAIQSMLNENDLDFVIKTYDIWSPYASPDQKAQLFPDLANYLIEEGHPSEVIEHHQFWGSFIPEQQHKEVFRRAIEAHKEEYGNNSLFRPLLKGFISNALKRTKNDEERTNLKNMFIEIIDDMEIEGIDLGYNEGILETDKAWAAAPKSQTVKFTT